MRILTSLDNCFIDCCTFPNGRVFAFDGFDEKLAEYNLNSSVVRSRAKNLTTPGKILKMSQNKNNLIFNKGNYFTVMRISQNSQFKEIARTEKLSQDEVADFEPFSSYGILSLTKSCVVSTIDFTRPKKDQIMSSVNLRRRFQGFERGLEAIACAISQDGSFVVISTGKLKTDSRSLSQHGLTLLRTSKELELTVASHLTNTPEFSKLGKGRCYTHMRILTLSRFEDPILLCFEGKYGYMQVFEGDTKPNSGYSVHAYMIKKDKLLFLDILDNFHEGNSFKNCFVDGFVWSIDNSGKISQLQFE